jgi:hypothetical protein
VIAADLPVRAQAHRGQGDLTVAATSGAAGTAERLGLSNGLVVQEFGYRDDVDQELRSQIEESVGSELVDEEYDDVTDVVLIWHRRDDDDLADILVDAQIVLDDHGVVWVLTPKAGRPGHVEHSAIDEAATTAGLHATSTMSIAPDWSATRLGTRGRGR